MPYAPCIILAALIVGAVTAFYFGLRRGAFAAAVTFGAFLAAAVAPALSIWAYVLVGVGTATVLTLGPKRADPTHAAKATRWLKRGIAAVRTRFPRK